MVLWKAAACGRLALDYCLFKVNWKQVRSHNAQAKIVCTSLLTYSTFRCTHLHFMPRYQRQRESLFRARSLAPFFYLNLSSMHCNHWFLDGNTNPLCQRGHFPPCTKLISIPHHPITPPHLIETAYIFQRQPHFFLYSVYVWQDQSLCLRTWNVQQWETKWSWQNIIQLTVVPLL